MNKQLINGNVLIFENGKYRINQENINVADGIVQKFTSNHSSKIVDMSGKILLPSLFNIHCHLGESLFKNICGDNWTLTKYLDYTNEYNKGLSKAERDRKWLESACYTIDKLKENATSVFCAARSAEIAKYNEISTMAGYPIMNNIKLDDYKNAGLQGFLKYKEEYLDEKCSVGVFLHSVYANDEVSLALAHQCMENDAEFITVHVAEDELSMKKEWNRYGKSAISVLSDYGLLNEKTILVHCGYVDDNDLKKIAKSGAIIAICPKSNEFLNTRMPDLYLLNKLGIEWCISTDGLGTGRSLSLFDQALKIREYFPKIEYSELFKRMTITPALLFKRKNYTGNINPGIESNMLVLDSDETDIEVLLEGIMKSEINWKYEKF